MMPFQYIPNHPVNVSDIITVRIGEPTDGYDYSWIENHGKIIMQIKCEDGIFMLVIKHEDKKKG